MYLLKIINVCSKIEGYRNEMHKLAMIKGLGDPEVLKLSMKLDKAINIYQNISTISQLSCTSSLISNTYIREK